MTASVVLNGARSGTRVSEGTRARIVEAAAKLRYRPNAVARGLARLRMDTIGVVSIIDGGEVNLYFLEVLSGILEAAAERGQNTTVLSVKDWHADEQKILRFCDGRVDGLILVGPMFSQAFAENILHYAPLVALHSSATIPACDLNVDDEAGAYKMVRYLIKCEHRRIAHFTGGERIGAQRRVAGYRRALEEAGIPFDPAMVVPGSFTTASGRERIRELLDRRTIDPFPTAIFCANDSIAYGCMEELAKRGIQVPQDVSVAGFDDLMTARMTNPPLTTMRQPFREMGHRAVDLLLLQIKKDTEKANSQTEVSKEDGRPADAAPSTSAAEPHVELFDTELVVRKSVGPPPSHPVIPRH